MRLAMLNRLKLAAVSSAVVSGLIGSTGCKPQPAPMRPQRSIVQPGTMPVTMPAPSPTTGPGVSMVGADYKAPSTTAPATQPGAGPTALELAPAVIPATQATTGPTTQATTEPVIPPINNAVRPVAQQTIDSDKTLAEQLAGIAELEFNRPVLDKAEWPWIFRHQAAVLAASAELNPTEARFYRLEADAMAAAHDSKGEEKALRQAIAANANDEFSWNRLMELYLGDMTELDTKVKYLSQVLGVDEKYEAIVPSSDAPPSNIPDDVRAHAGYLLSRAVLDRGEDEGAAKVLTESLKRCPSSIECLKLQYRLLPPETTASDRCAQLIKLLRANPLQPNYATEIADLIADNGLAREALPFYQLAVGCAHQQGDPAKHAMLNWAAALFVGDPKSDDAVALNAALLKLDPTFTPAYFLQLTITHYSGNKDAYTKALTEGGNAIGNRVIIAMNKIAPANPNKPSTRPVNDPSPLTLPDLGPTVDLLKTKGTEAQKQEFTEAVADLALIEGYFAHKPEAAAKLIDALAQLLPPDSPQLVRLQGWNDLLTGKTDDALTKFRTVAASDPLAEMGLVSAMLTNPTDAPAADNIARKLMQDHPAGLLGALLFDKLSSATVRMAPTNQAPVIRTQVGNFPQALLTAAESPKELYDMRLTPDSVGSYYMDPLLARITIQNTTNNDLTIGNDGMLKPQLLFNMMPDTPEHPNLEAFDTIAGQTVLPGHGRITQLVRVDQTPLLGFLNAKSDKVIIISGRAETNRIVGGAGGYMVPFDKSFFRKSSPAIAVNENQASADLFTGRADQAISALNRMELFVLELRAAAKLPKAKPTPDLRLLMQDIHRARGSALPAISAWAGKCEFDLEGDPQIVVDLAQDKDWRHRQVALLLVSQLDNAHRAMILKELMVDEQESVRDEAIAVDGRLSLPPAAPGAKPVTRPVATPATNPVAGP